MGFSWTEVKTQNSEVRRNSYPPTPGYGRLESDAVTGWIAGVNAWDGNILCNNCPGSYNHVITDRDRKDCGICSDTDMIAKFSCVATALAFRQVHPSPNRSLINIAP